MNLNSLRKDENLAENKKYRPKKCKFSISKMQNGIVHTMAEIVWEDIVLMCRYVASELQWLYETALFTSSCGFCSSSVHLMLGLTRFLQPSTLPTITVFFSESYLFSWYIQIAIALV